MKLLGISLVFATLSPVLLHAQADWPTLGNDPGGMKYSTLTQITPANVNKLVKAWTTTRATPLEAFVAGRLRPS